MPAEAMPGTQMYILGAVRGTRAEAKTPCVAISEGIEGLFPNQLPDIATQGKKAIDIYDKLV